MCLIFFKDEVSSVRLDKKINPPPLTIVPAPLDLQGGGNNFERDVPPPLLPEIIRPWAILSRILIAKGWVASDRSVFGSTCHRVKNNGGPRKILKHESGNSILLGTGASPHVSGNSILDNNAVKEIWKGFFLQYGGGGVMPRSARENVENVVG